MDERPPLAYDYIMGLPPLSAQVAWSGRSTVVYNLGIGFGAAAIEDPGLLDYVREEQPVTFPTMVCTLGTTGAGPLLDPASNIDFAGILHGEEILELFAPLPPKGQLTVTSRPTAIWDKGPGAGAVMALDRTYTDPSTGVVAATIRSIVILRNNGGFGGSNDGAPKALPIPDREPDGYRDMATLPEQALLYRLSGDLNPLHSDPETAKRAGFPRPILMGLCSFGIAGRALAAALGGQLTALRARFTGVVFPGETIRIEYWRLDDGEVAFRGRVAKRDAVVMNGGRAKFA